MAGCVEKVLKILTAISEGENKLVMLSAIAETTGIPKSSCVRIISEMVEEGYVKQVSRTRGYILGPAAYCLTRYGKYDSEFVAVCHPVLRWLHKKTDLCVGLAVIQHGKVFIINVINTEPKTAIFRYSSCVGVIVISVTSKNGTMQRALEWEQDIKKLMLQAHEAVVLTAKRIYLFRGI